MSDEILQLKMITNETVLCAFAPINDSIDDSFVIMCALEMIPIEEYEIDKEPPTKEYYLLRPWVTYTDDVRMEISVNPTNVVYIATPSKELKKQYFRSLKEIVNQLEDKQKDSDETEEVKSVEKKIGDVIAFKPRDTGVIPLNES